jgi:hypothetical protein
MTTVTADTQQIADTNETLTTDELVSEFESAYRWLIWSWLKRLRDGPWPPAKDKAAFDKAISTMHLNLDGIFFITAQIESLRSGRREPESYSQQLVRAVELAEEITADLRKRLADRTFETCRRCGRPLRDLDSRLIGYGRECAYKRVSYP